MDVMIMQTFYAPDVAGNGAPAPIPTPTKRVQGPFDKKTVAALTEAQEVAANAALAPYADVLATKYEITAAFVAQLASDIAQCQGLFGGARLANLSGQSSTASKDEAEDQIIEAIDEFRTGARLTLKTRGDLEAFGVGVDLERNQDVLVQLAQSILDNPVSPTLRGIGAEKMTALQTALANWKAASQSQSAGQASGQGTRADAETLFDSIEERAREIKLAIDGKFGFKKPSSVEARKLFHLPINRPYAPRMNFE